MSEVVMGVGAGGSLGGAWQSLIDGSGRLVCPLLPALHLRASTIIASQSSRKFPGEWGYWGKGGPCRFSEGRNPNLSPILKSGKLRPRIPLRVWAQVQGPN